MEKEGYKPNKLCRICGREKNKINHFYKSPSSKDGYRSACKVCENTHNTKIKKNGNIFFSEEIITLSKLHKTTKVQYFGYFVGLLIYIRNTEILAFSVLKGSRVFNKSGEGKAWLCQQLVKAADKIKTGLMSKL